MRSGSIKNKQNAGIKPMFGRRQSQSSTLHAKVSMKERKKSLQPESKKNLNVVHTNIRKQLDDMRQFQQGKDSIKRMKLQDFEHASGFKTSSVLEKFTQDSQYIAQQLALNVDSRNGAQSNFTTHHARAKTEQLAQYLAQEQLPISVNETMQMYEKILTGQRNRTPQSSRLTITHGQQQQQQMAQQIKRLNLNTQPGPAENKDFQHRLSNQLELERRLNILSEEQIKRPDITRGKSSNNKVIAPTQRRLKQFQPIQIIAATASTTQTIPLSCQIAHIQQNSFQTTKKKKGGKKDLKIQGQGNVPIVIALGQKQSPTNSKQINRTMSAVSRSKKSKQVRSKTVVPNNRGQTTLGVSRRDSQLAQRKASVFNDSSPTSYRKQNDPFANEKIALTFHATTSMMNTMVTPTMYYSSAQTKPIAQMTKEEVFKKISEQDAQLQGLMKLLERDLDGKPRTIQTQPIGITDPQQAQIMAVQSVITPTKAKNVTPSRNNHNKFQSSKKSLSAQKDVTQTVEDDIQSEDDGEPSMFLRLFEAFRDRLFNFPEIYETGLSDEDIFSIQNNPQIYMSLHFTFMTWLHQEMQHAVKAGDFVHKFKSIDDYQQPSGARTSRHPELTKSSSLLLDQQDVKPQNKSLNSLSQQTLVVLDASIAAKSVSVNNYQQQNQEEMMQNRDGQMIVGVSYSQKMQQRGIVNALNPPQPGAQVRQMASNDYPINQARNDSKYGKKKSNHIFSKKEHIGQRMTSKGSITASQGPMELSASVRNHISIDNIPDAAHGARNNNLSNSLQMLSGSDTIESRKQSMINNLQQPSMVPGEKSYHLRYISQGIQRSTSIESPIKFQNVQQSDSRQLQQSNDKILVLPSKSINDRATPSPIKQQYMTSQHNEKKTVQQASQNNRRSGISQNNLQPSHASIPKITSSESMVGRSLNVQSNHSSIIVDNANKQILGGGSMKFMASEYGPIQRLEGNRQSQQIPLDRKEFENLSGSIKKSIKGSQSGSKEHRNVPLMVNQRQPMIPSDYLLQHDGQTSNMMSGSQKVTQAATSHHNGKQKSNLTSVRSNVDATLGGGRPRGRGDKVINRQQQNSSDQSFKDNSASAFQSQLLDRTLKTAQIGSSQRMRGSKLESSYNVWEAPISQKFDFTKPDALMPQSRYEQTFSQKPKDNLVLIQNITPGQGRKPDFRQSTALPKSYKQFVATVTSGNKSQAQPPTIMNQPNQEQINMYKTTVGNFQANYDLKESRKQPAQSDKDLYLQALQNQNNVLQSQSKKVKKQRKDDVLKMINQLEFGENSDTLRNLAKQFYVKNIQSTGESNATGVRSSKEQVQTTVSKGAQVAAHHRETSSQPVDTIAIQKQLWQQFQLLRILKQTKYQHQLQKYQNRGETSQPANGPPGSQSLEYGFELTEEEMYARLFHKELSSKDKKKLKSQQQTAASKEKDKDENQPYASFDCIECVQMASLMLEEELRYYIQRNHGKRSKGGKSRDSLYRQNGTSGKSINGQQHKGIAGLATQGVSMRNQKLAEETDGSNNLGQTQEMTMKTQGKRSRAQTQNQPGMSKRNGSVLDDAQLIGQIFISRAQPQIFFKKQLNQGFRQVIRGEQMTQHMKQGGFQSCTCGAATANRQSGPYQTSSKNGKICVCKKNYDEPPIPFQYGFQQRMGKPKFHMAGKHHLKQGNHGHQSSTTATGEEGHNIQAPAKTEVIKNVLDGTVTGHKRKYKTANGIYQPPLQPFKHLSTSAINSTINKINDLVLILFKGRMKQSDQQIIKLLKYFQIPIPKGNGTILDQKMIKQPDFLHAVNQKLLVKLYRVMNHENADAKPEQSTQIFRFYVGKGNNYPSVRQIISKRSWWNRGNQKQEKFYGQKNYDGESEVATSQPNGLTDVDQQQMLSNKQFSSGCHFIWTQWRKTEHHDFLKRVTQDYAKQKKNEVIMGKSTLKRNKRSAKQIYDPKMIVPAPLANVPTLIYNRLDDNFHLSNKKALFLNISTYYQAMGINPFEVAIPLTFNVKTPHANDAEYMKFQRAYKAFEQQKDNNIWIIKPGENSNRGTGIQVASSFNEIRTMIQSLSSNNGNRTSIVQKYLDKPLLIHNRKFDIRGYALITSVNGVLKGYMYRDCYFRTSSKQFDLTNLSSRFIHLTNDAIQMNSEDYGRYESGNKLSINDFQRYLDTNHTSKNVCFMRDLFPQMERLVTDSFRAVGSKIDPRRLNNCFEIFGYDFMIDENFKTYLIEANTNPCLEICSPLLARIIPELLDNSFRIAVDPLYQPSQFLAKLKDETSSTTMQTGESTRDFALGISQPKTDTGKAAEGDITNSPIRRQKVDQSAAAASKETTQQSNQNNQKRQRLELLTQIKYTLIYDERIDKPIVDKILSDYEKRLKQPAQVLSNAVAGGSAVAALAPAKEGAGAAAARVPQPLVQQADKVEREGAAVAIPAPKSLLFDDTEEMQLMREIVEEEKLDEQAAKKEEVELAEDEEAGIMPQPLMLMQPAAAQAVSDDDEDDLESEDDYDN